MWASSSLGLVDALVGAQLGSFGGEDPAGPAAAEDESPLFVTPRACSLVAAASTALSVNIVSDSVSSSHSCAGSIE